ncbi:aminoglycoside phosphotransferase family protein [Marinobacter sediminicola]|uniref:aminoglycoside phosphotransferase family protein n=1 Tax=Marinobacter sediminicola TaxID=3072994 RepID=UPI002810D7C7|nr:aminoglycoside phosphotransferase family protein [Marinobacter sp. F26243]
MYFIKHLLSTAGLLDDHADTYSIACVSTSRPIYLVFNINSDYPAYVVRKLDDAHAFHSNHIHSELYSLVGNLVPEPVGIYEHASEKYDVQRGVKGAPWFQVKSKIRSEDERKLLETRMWQTLTNFHAAIRAKEKIENKTNKLKPHEELRKAFLEYQSTGETENTELEKLVELAINDLSQMPNCSSIPQHGDFCLNNLIIDTGHITVIDFEDFAITAMPMYDHFTLALSLPSCGPSPFSAAQVITNRNLVNNAQIIDIPENTIKWHFLHHLLLRLGPWSTGVKRKSYRIWLIKVLESFLFNQKYEKNDLTNEL